ncbi:hypothetical protein OG900_06135 [Streptomyces sp. NBC_00433]
MLLRLAYLTATNAFAFLRRHRSRRTGGCGRLLPCRRARSATSSSSSSR